MGGRVAEEIIFGMDNLSTGCSGDLKKATEIAQELVRKLSTSKEGKITLGASKDDLSDKTNSQMDKEVESLLRDSLHRTRAVLESNRDNLEKLARKLLEKETLSAAEVRKTVSGYYF